MVSEIWNGEIVSFGSGKTQPRDGRPGKDYGTVTLRGDYGEKTFKSFYRGKFDKFSVGQRVHVVPWEHSKQGDIIQDIQLGDYMAPVGPSLQPSNVPASLVEQAMEKAGAPMPYKPSVIPSCHDETTRRIWFGCCLNNAGAICSQHSGQTGTVPAPEVVAAYAQELYAKTKDFAGVA